jgi:hypothetical protein
MSLERAALGEGFGKEIEDHRAVAQLVLQMQLERLAGESAAGAEIGRLGTDGQRGLGRNNDESSGNQSCEKLAHGDSP